MLHAPEGALADVVWTSRFRNAHEQALWRALYTSDAPYEEEALLSRDPHAINGEQRPPPGTKLEPICAGSSVFEDGRQVICHLRDVNLRRYKYAQRHCASNHQLRRRTVYIGNLRRRVHGRDDESMELSMVSATSLVAGAEPALLEQEPPEDEVHRSPGKAPRAESSSSDEGAPALPALPPTLPELPDLAGGAATDPELDEWLEGAARLEASDPLLRAELAELDAIGLELRRDNEQQIERGGAQIAAARARMRSLFEPGALQQPAP